MNEKMSDILDLKYHIDKAKSIVEEEQEIAEQYPDNFALQFAAMVNQSTLNHKIEELENLQKESLCELYEYRLTGDNIGYGSAPVELVGDFLSSLQKVINRIAQNIEEHVPTPNIPKYITDKVALNIQAFAPGSFKVICNAKLPDQGLFNDMDEVLNDTLLVKSNMKMFEIISTIDNQEQLIEIMENYHPYTISAIADFFKTTGKAGVNIDAVWNGVTHKDAKHLDKDSLFRAYELLNKFDKEPRVYNDIFTGSIVSMDMRKKCFGFVNSDNKRFNVYFSEVACPELRKHDVNPLYEDKKYNIEFKVAEYNSPSGKKKVKYLFNRILNVL